MKLHKINDFHFSKSLQSFDHAFQWLNVYKWADLSGAKNTNYIFDVSQNIFKYNSLRMYYEIK